MSATLSVWFLGLVLLLSSLGVILVRKPVYSSLYFLLTLLSLAALYLQLSAQFIAVMQILIYAGAILVIFMFVIILFQDAYKKIEKHEPKTSYWLLGIALTCLITALGFLVYKIKDLPPAEDKLPAYYGTVESLGQTLYIDFFFPFEAVVLVFLVALIGAFYVGRKGI